MSHKTFTFNSLRYDEIFNEHFSELIKPNKNTITFNVNNNCGIVVIYAPNGTGKTTLANLLSLESSTETKNLLATFENEIITPESKKFQIIGDESTRNIIRGNTSDYLIGEDIHREYELKHIIEDIFSFCFTRFSKTLKDHYKITRQDDYFLTRLSEQDSESKKISSIIQDIIPNRNKRSQIERINFAQFIKALTKSEIDADYSNEHVQFIINQRDIVKKILYITNDIGCNLNIEEYEKNNDALYILNKYPHQTTCIVCNATNISVSELSAQKTILKQRSYENLSIEQRQILDNIINSDTIKSNDPFFIHDNLLEYIKTGNTTYLNTLQDALEHYVIIITQLIRNEFIDIFSISEPDDASHSSMKPENIFVYIKEYEEIISRQQNYNDEELLLINNIVNENIGPEITIVRDKNNDNNLRLHLNGKAFLGEDVGEKANKPLELSTGERNFVSLAFELLKARHSDKKFIVLDDPISSFDSIYKNKIAFCILKFLENKNSIILTHNLDLVKLLEHQLSGCFNLYLLSNNNDGKNGFIQINKIEKDLLINLHALIRFFRNAYSDMPLSKCIINKKNFLLSMIPFMRGYAHILCTNDDIYKQLSNVMHGYNKCTDHVDVADIYYKLFGVRLLESYEVSVKDILDLDCNSLVTLDPKSVPLLAETLKQSLIYYHLRMSVEHTIINLYPNVRQEGEIVTLGQILYRAFNNDPNNRTHRVFFSSRKTLLNDFNHFEGNMNIFQSAIDIEDSILQKEVEVIHTYLNKLIAERG